MPKKLLLFFPLSCRFFLDIDAARFYTFFNCNITIAESMQPIERENRQMATKKAAKKAAKKAPAKKAAKKAAKKK
jgi:hypothetical protein